MKVQRHDSGSRTAPSRGRELGATWAGPIRAAVTAYQGHFRDLGVADDTVAAIADASTEALSRWSPELGDELTSIAEGARLTTRQLGLLNARTEVLAAAPPPSEGECSTLVRVPPANDLERATAFQTWDWHSALVPEALMWRYEPAPGQWVKTFTEPGMLAKIGINARGLAVHLNILHHGTDSASGGVPVHAIARRILDEAATVGEAFDIAQSAEVSASSVLTVLATGSGAPEASSIEVSPAGTALVPASEDGWLVHTNHFLDHELREGAGLLDESSTSLPRYAHLEGLRATDPSGAGLSGSETQGPRMPGTELPALARTLCGPAGAATPICMQDNLTLPVHLRWRTLLSILLHPSSGSIEYWPGRPDEVAGEERAHTF